MQQQFIEILKRSKKGTSPGYFNELSNCLNKCGYFTRTSAPFAELLEVLKSLPSNCRPDLGDVVIFVIRNEKRLPESTLYEVLVSCKVRRLTEKIIGMMNDTIFSSLKTLGGFNILHHLVTTKKFGLAKKVLNQGHDYLSRCVSYSVKCRGLKLNDLKFIMRYAHVRGIKTNLDIEDLWCAAKYACVDVLEYCFAHKLFKSVLFRQLTPYMEYIIHLNDKKVSAESIIFLLNIGVLSANIAFNKTCLVDVKIHILESMLVSNVSFSGIETGASGTQFTHMTNLMFDRGLFEVYGFIRIYGLTFEIRDMLRNFASFRVMAMLIKKGPPIPGGIARHPFTESDRRRTLQRVFKAGEYGPKDPGFLLMFWATANRGGRRRLPREITRLVFEAAYMKL